MTDRWMPGSLRRWRELPANAVDADRFIRALNAIAEPFRQSAGRLAPALGQTRLLVPLTLFLRQEYTQLEIVSILLRLQALQALIRDGALDGWVERDPEDEALLDVHPLVVEVAAVVPLDEDDRFNAEVFLSHLARITAGADRDRPAATVKVPAP